MCACSGTQRRLPWRPPVAPRPAAPSPTWYPGFAQAELDAALTGLRAGLDRALRADGVLGEPRCTVVRPRASTCARALVAATGAERCLDAGLLRRPPDRRRGGGRRRSRARRRSHRGHERASTDRPGCSTPVPCLVDLCGRAQPRDLAAEPLLDDRLAIGLCRPQCVDADAGVGRAVPRPSTRPRPGAGEAAQPGRTRGTRSSSRRFG